MKNYVQRQQATPKTIQSKASNQALAEEVLQSYKKKIVQMQSMYEDEPLQGKFNDTAQREELDEEELLQGKFDTAQREEIDEDELLQGKFEASSTIQREEVTPIGGEGANNTGMSDNLKNGIESLSGYSMDDVRVHYNSPKPAQLQALAYAQGTDIHIAPGKEQHLPHEAWHIVQQKQGRVQPTTQLQGVNVNDNEGLEREADVMGGKSIQFRKKISFGVKKNSNSVLQRSWDGYVSGTGGILGGGIITTLGIRDAYNAIKDHRHITKIVDNENVTIEGASGYMEKVDKGRVKAKLEGAVSTQWDEARERKGPPGTKRRIGEGILNTLAGGLGIGAGISAIIPGGQIPAAIMAGGAAILSGVAALGRWWRGRK